MTAIAVQRSEDRGLRPVDLRRDLRGIATLIETCFGRALDQGGRHAVREMYALSRTGPFIWLLGSILRLHPTWHMGYVWIEAGRVVGNVGVQPAGPRSRCWLIANVAVHPEYRRRGIARRLVQAALELAAQRGAQFAVLQVDNDNAAAIQLYQSMDFETTTVRTTWARRAGTIPRLARAEGFDIRPVERGDWQSEFELLATCRPEGMTWTTPLDIEQFRPSPWRSMSNLLYGREERWVAGRHNRFAGWFRLQYSFGPADQLDLVVRPQWRAELERPLLVRALRRLGRRPWGLQIDQPVAEATDLLQEFDFRPLRTLRWMRYRL